MVVTRNDVDLVVNLQTGQVTRTNVVRDVTLDANFADVIAKARTAKTANQGYVNIASPTNAQLAAQVKALTRQNIGLINLLGKLLPELADLLNDNGGT